MNHYAALPSMHVGWTFLLAVALFQAFRGWPLRGVFFAIPMLMWTATIVTGNHYFLDGVLGLVVAAIALRVSLYIQKRGEEKAVRQLELEAPSSQ